MNKQLELTDEKEQGYCCIYEWATCRYDNMGEINHMTDQQSELVDFIRPEVDLVRIWTGDSNCDHCPSLSKLDALVIVTKLESKYKLIKL